MLLSLLAACTPADFSVDRAPDPPEDSAEAVTDADGDGFGPATDCDDANADVNPAAEETCNGLDDDCDGDTDEELAAIDYEDADGDGYGDDATAFATCDAPGVLHGGDCDDADAAVHPDADEICDEVDDDCDGEIDEGVALTTYTDADGDGYGAGQPGSGCDGVTNDRDCDDADATVNPAADDLCDGQDDDCDGAPDDDDADCDGVVDVPAWGGTGADGALDVTDTVTLSSAWGVAAIAGEVVTLASAPAGLAAGDEVLIVNLHGSDAAHTHVGAWETATVTAVAGVAVTVDALGGTYGETTNADLAGQAVQLVRVAQYTDVTIERGGVLTTTPWDGAAGGVLAMRVQESLTIEDGGAIVADGLGYAGGAKGSGSDHDGRQGESYAGEGDGDHSGGEGYNEGYGCWAANYGGGGANITGGGGAYGDGATAGDSWTGGGATAPEAGETYGDADLARLFLGSGGGGVWNDGAATAADGGSGGGIVFVAARDVVADGAGAITATGASTSGWSTGSWTYGAGGGAGGTVWVVADTVTLATEAIDATGGFGESTHTRAGGDGGVGRVRIDCVEADGAACTTAALAGAAEPDPGYVGAP